MSEKPPTLNYQTPPMRPRWPVHRLALILLVLCVIITVLGSWQFQRARAARRAAIQQRLIQRKIQAAALRIQSGPIASEPAPAQAGPTTNNFLSIRAGDGDGARPVLIVPEQASSADHGFTRPSDSQEGKYYGDTPRR